MSEAFVIIAQERSEEQEVEIAMSPAEVELEMLGKMMDGEADARRENRFGCSL